MHAFLRNFAGMKCSFFFLKKKHSVLESKDSYTEQGTYYHGKLISSAKNETDVTITSSIMLIKWNNYIFWLRDFADGVD